MASQPKTQTSVALEVCRQELLGERNEGRLSDDSLQLVSNIIGDQAMLMMSHSAQLPVLTLSTLTSVERLSNYVNQMLERSQNPALEACARFVGTIHLPSIEHWVSFEVVNPVHDPSFRCRNVTLLDSLLPPGYCATFLATPVVQLDKQTGRMVGFVDTCNGSLGSDSNFAKHVSGDLVDGLCVLALMLEIYTHRYRLHTQQQYAQEHDNDSAGEQEPLVGDLPNFAGGLPDYMVTLRSYGTQQEEPHIDCGLYVLAHRISVLCSPVLRRQDAETGPLTLSMREHLRSIKASESLQDQVMCAFNQYMQPSAQFDNPFLVPQASTPPTVRPEFMRQQLLNQTLQPNFLSSLQGYAGYSALKALEWTVCQLVAPIRRTYRYEERKQQRRIASSSTYVHPVPLRDPKEPRPKLIVCADRFDRSFWMDRVTYLLAHHGLLDEWKIEFLDDHIANQRLDAESALRSGMDPPAPAIENTQLVVNFGAMDVATYKTTEQHFDSLMHIRKWLCLDGVSTRQDRHLTFLNMFHHRFLPCRRCPECACNTGRCRQIPAHIAANGVDWQIQIGSTIELPSMSRPAPDFMTTEPPANVPAINYIEHDVLDMDSRKLHGHAREAIPDKFDVSRLLRTRLYSTGWDPMYEIDKFYATSSSTSKQQSPDSPNDCFIVSGNGGGGSSSGTRPHPKRPQ